MKSVEDHINAIPEIAAILKEKIRLEQDIREMKSIWETVTTKDCTSFTLYWRDLNTKKKRVKEIKMILKEYPKFVFGKVKLNLDPWVVEKVEITVGKHTGWY